MQMPSTRTLIVLCALCVFVVQAGCGLVENAAETIPLADGQQLDLSACVDNLDVCLELLDDNRGLFPVLDADGNLVPQDEVDWWTILQWAADENGWW